MKVEVKPEEIPLPEAVAQNQRNITKVTAVLHTYKAATFVIRAAFLYVWSTAVTFDMLRWFCATTSGSGICSGFTSTLIPSGFLGGEY